jgi:hypothetical protein
MSLKLGHDKLVRPEPAVHHVQWRILHPGLVYKIVDKSYGLRLLLSPLFIPGRNLTCRDALVTWRGKKVRPRGFHERLTLCHSPPHAVKFNLHCLLGFLTVLQAFTTLTAIWQSTSAQERYAPFWL